MRITIIDGFRGFFLVFMMIVHANEILHTTLGKLNHHYVGWVEDAQGFVFLSGLVVGIVYSGTMIRGGADAMTRRIHARMKTIYSHQAFLIALMLAATFVLLYAGLTPVIFEEYRAQPVLFTGLSLLLVTGSMHMGILPMYIFFMAATPFALKQFSTGRSLTVLTIVVCLWLFAQSGLGTLALRAVQGVLADAGYPVRLGIFFDIFGWQVLFFSGLLLGYLAAAKRLDLGWMDGPDGHKAVGIALAAIVALAIFDRIVFDDWLGGEFSRFVLERTDRGALSPIYVIAFFLDLFVIAWLIRNGAASSNGLYRFAARVIDRVFTWKPLVFLGQHSLHVFTGHIVIVYILAVLFEGAPPPQLLGSILLLLCVVALYGVAWGHAWNTRRTAVPKTAQPSST